MVATTDRVMSNTEESLNEQIRRIIEANIAYYARHKDQIDERLRELDEEWDIERTLQANAASLTLAGTVLGTLFRRRWLVLPMLVGGFLLQHAIQGWCPPLIILRRLGVRTIQEIDTERYALKALRGDFSEVQQTEDAAQVVEALER